MLKNVHKCFLREIFLISRKRLMKNIFSIIIPLNGFKVFVLLLKIYYYYLMFMTFLNKICLITYKRVFDSQSTCINHNICGICVCFSSSSSYIWHVVCGSVCDNQIHHVWHLKIVSMTLKYHLNNILVYNRKTFNRDILWTLWI